MAPQYGIKYAVHIISSHFGDLVAKVCDCLLKKGPLTLQNIVRFTELSNSQVKKCLLVLIQQNCVQAFVIEHQDGPGDASKRTTQYLAVFDNIIHRMRFSKFLVVVSQELGKECMDVFQGLLQHGRLTLEKMVDRAEQSQGSSKAQEVVRRSLFELVHAHFVERCPAPEPNLSQSTEEEPPAKKRGPKSSKVVAVPGLLERVLAAAAPIESKRFLFITDNEIEIDGEDGDNLPGVGEKRKYSILDSEITEQKVLWRVNYEEFLHRFRHKACIDSVRKRLDEDASIVLSAMLQATRSMEKKVRTETSAPLSINTIFEEVMKGKDGHSMTLDRVRASLILLGCVKGADDSYRIELKNIIDQAQSEEVESIVLKRYEKDAYRIFRLLSKTNRLVETDKVADTAFVDKKKAPEILFRLWNDDFLHMEKVVVAGARQSQFLLWKVDKLNLWRHVLDEMYHAALNLSLRVAFELEKENELLNLPIEKKVSGPMKERYDRLKKVRMVLESSLLNLDDALMLFHDF